MSDEKMRIIREARETLVQRDASFTAEVVSAVRSMNAFSAVSVGAREVWERMEADRRNLLQQVAERFWEQEMLQVTEMSA